MSPTLENLFEHVFFLSITENRENLETKTEIKIEIETFNQNLAQYLQSRDNIDFTNLDQGRIKTIDDDFLTIFLELYSKYLETPGSKEAEIIFPKLPGITKYGEDALERFSAQNRNIIINLGEDMIGPILDGPTASTSSDITTEIEIPNTGTRPRRNALDMEGIAKALEILRKIPSANSK